jgi:hypothetical protein
MATAGEFKQAIEAAQKIEHASSKASALSDIASAMATAGEIKQALELAQKIENARYKASALRNIASITSPNILALTLRGMSIELVFEPVLNANKRRVKKLFTPEEKKTARLLLDITKSVYASISRSSLNPVPTRTSPSRPSSGSSRPGGLKPVPRREGQ